MYNVASSTAAATKSHIACHAAQLKTHTSTSMTCSKVCVLSIELLASTVKVKYGGHLCLHSCMSQYDCAHRPLPISRKRSANTLQGKKTDKNTCQKSLRKGLRCEADQFQHQRMFLHPWVKTVRGTGRLCHLGSPV